MADTAGPDQEASDPVRQSRSFLPPFANAENRALDGEIKRLEQELEAVDISIEEHGGRIAVMEEQLKNVRQEITYTESRMDAERREAETEKHLRIMAEKELARMRADVARLQRERADLSDRAQSLQAAILRGGERLDAFRLAMNWNQDELEQWAAAERAKEEDSAAVEGYRRQDEGKLRELSLAVEKLTREVAAKREELDAEITETQAAQIQLDRAAEDFRRLHGERRDLIAQWDEAAAAMRRRDEAIRAASGAFAERRAALRRRRAELDAQAGFLEAEVAANRELEGRVAHYEKEVAAQREAHRAEQAKLTELNHQVELLKSTLSRAANELAGQAVSNEAAREALEAKRQRLESVQRRQAALQRRLEEGYGQLSSLEARVAELEGVRRAEDARLKGLQKEVEGLKKDQFRAGQALFALRQRERELISEISGGQGQNRNLAARLLQLDEQSTRQQEVLYDVEYALQDMERKLSRAQGHRTEDETRALRERIEQLTGTLEGVAAEHSMLVEQVKAAEVALQDSRRANEAFGKDRTRLEARASELVLESDSLGRSLKGAVAARERALVEHDVLKLQVKRLREVLALAADEVTSLEARKAALRLGLEERRAEVEVHRDALRAELKLVREDLHRVTLELRERQLKVEKLETKFEALTNKSRATDPEGGPPKSQAYYVIKAAQEREELQAAGDRLDSQITKAEREVAALEGTLSQLQATNSAFSASLRAGEDSAARAQAAALRQRLDHTHDRLGELRAEEARLEAALQDAAVAGEGAAEEERALAAAVEDLARQAAEAERGALDQREKRARAAHGLARAVRAARPQVLEHSQQAEAPPPQEQERQPQAQAAGAPLPLDRDARLAELREALRGMTNDIRALAAAHPGEGILESLEAAGLRLPPAGSRAGSRAGSSAGGSRAASRQSSLAEPSAAGSGSGGASARSRGSTRSGGSEGSDGSRRAARGARGRPD
ncbi:flagella associated protein [Raphidocelis subcapitata]|uniref:Flagella associated protein n=1 Tax=Raphidocelis subcapitata TaxID=307507 RepID=A0A2V0P489_9CHLO|nr:flagella associated protein [Raphidocelis subcapitata]|eukprot:GBF94678.1 flagella associated protein [Raphidocelis subcapitata]